MYVMTPICKRPLPGAHVHSCFRTVMPWHPELPPCISAGRLFFTRVTAKSQVSFPVIFFIHAYSLHFMLPGAFHEEISRARRADTGKQPVEIRRGSATCSKMNFQPSPCLFGQGVRRRPADHAPVLPLYRFLNTIRYAFPVYILSAKSLFVCDPSAESTSIGKNLPLTQ